MLSKNGVRQFILYATIGVVGTGGHFITLVLLVEYIQLAAVWATTVGFVVGAGINYFLNYHYTFSSNKAHSDALFKFFLVALLGAGINMSIIYVGVNVLVFHYLLAQIAASSIVLLWTFSVNKEWTFKNNLCSQRSSEKQ